ncbi:MAG: hypothetical protein EXX96DRAFT_595360 [Benjaminiella poitrasii]|nr:MAG: hypothetical protein EXX96DRAFT_595360 [Benjaminiella poitrasii]
MAQMMKQFGQDRSLQRDQFAGPSQQNAGPSTMRTQRQQGPSFAQGGDMVNEFFGQEQQQPRMGNNNFEFSALQRELDTIRQAPSMAPVGGNWTAEFHQQGPKIWELTPAEEAAMEKAFIESKAAAGPTQSISVWRDEFMNHPEVTNMNPAQLAEFETAFQKHFEWAHEFDLQQGKGKQPFDLNKSWEEQFASFDQPSEEEMARKVEEAAAAQDPSFEQFENVWQNIRDQMAEEDNGWEDEFGNFGNGHAIYKPDLGEYVFEVNNTYMNHPDPMTEGLRLLGSGGSLSDAAMAFEAVVQKNPQDSEAWMHLGNAQAQNEKEEPAIRALEKAIEVDPGNLQALMSLAVSYTNESYDHAAYQTLERWITQKYPHLAGDQLPEAASPFELHDRVTNLFLTAARQAPEGQLMDPDVQVGLGVLFYGSGDLDKAIDCFVAALKGRPDDYLLWNRMGATLANNGRSEEAIDAYHKALELRPSFVRARYNIGVSCINIGCYKEAAEHILTALSMHKRGNGDSEEGVNVSNNSWEMLRKAFIMMDRRDLADKAVVGADLNQFRPEFEF